MDKEQLRGSLDLLVLSRILQQQNYGGGIIQDILRDSNEQLEISEGSLYSLLKRLEKKQLIVSHWESTQRRKYYQLTKKGMFYVEQKLADWRLLNQLIESAIGEDKHDD
ncbi:PadR family transcriptional regulator [Kurthia huakuii]|uniref:PadR family transcriptional regulator n=1 Tax=Kurthia huakuii TaxID=1421019 RepID=UPI000496600B|nr:helix-turn-helix transcriptional regulator [Kurthia huakuii]MBM7698794.1 DNA-binding PadR family transcriptional regulator [Kurthia huakuii]